MSDSSQSSTEKTSATDSPWFWTMVFSGAALVALVIVWPQYVKRQRRLEMQFHAQQEVIRRRAAGEQPARLRGSEGESPPPVPGELIIPIWPLAVLAFVLSAISAFMFWRTRDAPGRNSAEGDVRDLAG